MIQRLFLYVLDPKIIWVCQYVSDAWWPSSTIWQILCPKGPIDDSSYYVFLALCIVVIVVSLIKIAASNENIECFREYFAVGYHAPDPSFF